MPTLRRASLPFALLLPVLLGLAGGSRSAGSESAVAAVATAVAGHADLERSHTSLAQAYLGSTPVVLSFAAPQNMQSARSGVGPVRCRHARDPQVRALPSQASRVRSTRLARLDFANALDAALSGHRSVHSTTLPPPHSV